MKIKRNKNWSIVFRTIQKFTMVLLSVFVLVSCSKDDEDSPDSSILLKTQTFEIKGLNDCKSSKGAGSTTFLYIPYTAPAGTSISKLHRITRVSNGESDKDVSTVFKNKNNIIEWATCIRFGSQSWMEFEIRMETTDGTLSNSSIVRINKPAGAN